MPRYFFDTYDGERLLTDDIGVEFENFTAAKAAAQQTLPDMAREVLGDGTHRSFVVSVRDVAGTVVLRVALTMVVEEGDVDT
jgi:hypothetical protein